MSWTEVFPAACGLLYLGAAAAYGWQGQWAWTWTYLCYALANTGLIAAAIASRN
jgi:hypothetical protein